MAKQTLSFSFFFNYKLLVRKLEDFKRMHYFKKPLLFQKSSFWENMGSRVRGDATGLCL